MDGTPSNFDLFNFDEGATPLFSPQMGLPVLGSSDSPPVRAAPPASVGPAVRVSPSPPVKSVES